MKMYVYALFLIGVLSQCAQEKADPAQSGGKLNKEFTLRPDQSILLTSPSDGAVTDTSKAIKARIIQVSDSLCPAGFQCLTAGSAKLTLQVSRGQLYSDTLYLCLGDCDYYLTNSPFKSDSANFEMAGTQYAAYFKGIESSGKGWEKTVERVTLLIESK